MPDPPTAFLDACVLYPSLVRGALLAAADHGRYRPAWSPRVLAEWRIAALRDGAEEAGLDKAVAAMTALYPGALAAHDPDLEASLQLPDPADVHVLAGAVSAGATMLVTFNLRDFPTRRLARFGIEPRHPDGLLWQALSEAPDTLGVTIAALLAACGISEPRAGRKALKRALLPRLGKAWEAWAAGPGSPSTHRRTDIDRR
ncbi:MAG: PIN domain-containing protein [Pseudomonadota bacterium]